MIQNVSTIGLGKLGAPLAACLASKGLHVVAVDVDEKKVDAVNSGRAPVHEPGLEEMIEENRPRLKATTSIAEAIAATGVTFIVVPTPSAPDGEFSLEYALTACAEIGKALAEKDGYHLVVMTSTVMPGSTGGPILDALQKHSGKKAGFDFGLCYSPEFIALGSVIRDFLHPDFLLIGESDPRAGQLLADLYLEVVDGEPPVARMTFVNAELAKLAVNTFVTTKISFANMLARICEKLPGGDVDSITSAIGLDSRIGRRYLTGAVAYGGPCFPRDNLALRALARSVGAPFDIAEATDSFNRGQIVSLANMVAKHLGGAGTVAILGLSYKPDTDVVEEATGSLLAAELLKGGHRVVAFDPAGGRNASARLGAGLELAESADACVRAGDVVVVATPWSEFRGIDVETWRSANGNPRVVVDCWRMLAGLRTEPGIHYIALGTGAYESAAPEGA